MRYDPLQLFDSSFDSLVLRISKGQTRTNLIAEYSRLKKPGANKSLHEVIKEVELEMSANVTFELEEVKTDKGKIELYIKTGKSSVKLPSDRKWNKQVYLDPKTNIPFVSDGKTSVHCIQFFQDDAAPTPEESKVPPPTAPTQVAVPLPNQGPGSPEVPLPGPINPSQFDFGGLGLWPKESGKKNPPPPGRGSFLGVFSFVGNGKPTSLGGVERCIESVTYWKGKTNQL